MPTVGQGNCAGFWWGPLYPQGVISPNRLVLWPSSLGASKFQSLLVELMGAQQVKGSLGVSPEMFPSLIFYKCKVFGAKVTNLLPQIRVKSLMTEVNIFSSNPWHLVHLLPCVGVQSCTVYPKT